MTSTRTVPRVFRTCLRRTCRRRSPRTTLRPGGRTAMHRRPPSLSRVWPLISVWAAGGAGGLWCGAGRPALRHRRRRAGHRTSTTTPPFRRGRGRGGGGGGSCGPLQKGVGQVWERGSNVRTVRLKPAMRRGDGAVRGGGGFAGRLGLCCTCFVWVWPRVGRRRLRLFLRFMQRTRPKVVPLHPPPPPPTPQTR